MTEIPEKPWQVVSVDFGGPYPDGHYNLVIIDKGTRYPEVEVVYSTAMKSTKEKLKKIFAAYGTPEQLESDNGPPFSSKEFAEFALEEGLKHHRITPLHPRANGEAESFMKLLNKTEQRADLENKSTKIAIQELLTGYRSTPHPATGVTPYEAMMNRHVRTKLDYMERQSKTDNPRNERVNKRDNGYKMKIKGNAENKNLTIGDHVLLEQNKRNKWTTPYEPIRYVIYKVKGASIWGRRVTDGREVCRYSTCFKYVHRPKQFHTYNSVEQKQKKGELDDWRGDVLRKTKEGMPYIGNNQPNNRTVSDQQNEHQPLQIIDNDLRRSQRIRQRPQRYGDFIYY